MSVELGVMLYWCVVIAVVTAAVAFLVWFILTLSRIQRNTRRTAEDVARLVEIAERTAPPRPPVPPLRDDMTPAELLAAIEAVGGRLRIVDGYFTGRRAVIDNPSVVGEQAVRLLEHKQGEVLALLLARERT